MANKLIETDWIPLKLAGLGDDIQHTVLAIAEIISHPVALAYPHDSNGKIINHTIEMRGLLVGNMATPVDMTFKAYRAPIVSKVIADWDDQRDWEAFYTKNLDYSDVGAPPGSELITGGNFTDVLNDTGAAVTAGSATVALDAATNLSAVVAGQFIFLQNIVGINGTDIFEIIAVNDGADTVDVRPIPIVSDTNILWIIGVKGWDEVGNGWNNLGGRAAYDPSTSLASGGKLGQTVAQTDGNWYNLLYDFTQIPADSGVPKGFSVKVGSQNVDLITDDAVSQGALYKRAANSGPDEITFESTGDAQIDNVSLNEVNPFWFSDIRRFDEAADKGAGSAIAYGFLPTASMAGARLSAWVRRYGGAY